jgi:hypothetical protein
MSAIPTIVAYGLREALRRKVFAVVLLLTLGFLGLYWLANHYAFRDVENIVPPAGIDARTFAGAFIFGLAMFATLSEACSSHSSSARWAGRPCCSRAGSALSPSARRTSSSCTSARC